jgi:NADH-quinone oxidoreductase subunit C
VTVTATAHSSALAPERILTRLREQFPGAAIRRVEGDAIRDFGLEVPASSLVEIATFLRDDREFEFAFLSWIAGVDWLPADPRFEVVYGLLSLVHNTRLNLRVRLSEENPRVPSVVSVWPTADWHERETYDFYGIEFTGHPDLRRILLPEDWVGWPLRKDSPLGYEEVAFTHNTPGRRLPAPDLTRLKPKKVTYRAQ